MFDFMKKGFRNNKKLTRKQRDNREAGQAFFDDYKKLCDQHGKQLSIINEFTKENGVRAMFSIEDYVPKVKAPTQVTEWSKAKQENLDLRENCVHDLSEEGDMSFCGECKLPKKDWGMGDVGYHTDAKERALESIEREKAKEEALKTDVQE